MPTDVYNTKEGKYEEGKGPSIALTGGWKLSTTKFDDVDLTDDKSGFNSAVYERIIGRDKKGNNILEYAYVTEGTDPLSAADWETNAKQAVGEYTKQYDISTNNARKLDEFIGTGELSFAGHSLGGGLASANALATGRSATTFNAAGLSNGTRSLFTLNRPANIRAYVVEGEAVSNTQRLLGLRAEGKIVSLPATYLPYIPWWVPDSQKPNIAIGVINAGLSIYNHTMGVVMDKMDKAGIK
ncbi:MAG: hypothetical protein WD077_13535 [Bacteroidia bacterium]